MFLLNSSRLESLIKSSVLRIVAMSRVRKKLQYECRLVKYQVFFTESYIIAQTRLQRFEK